MNARDDEDWLAHLTTGLFLILSPLHLVFIFAIKQETPQVKVLNKCLTELDSFKLQILIQTIAGAILYTVLGSTSINSSFKVAADVGRHCLRI